MNRTQDAGTYFICAEGLSFVGDQRVKTIFEDILQTDNYDFSIHALKGMKRIGWDEEKLNAQAIEEMLKNYDFYHLPIKKHPNKYKFPPGQNFKKELLYDIICSKIWEHFKKFEHKKIILDFISTNIKSQNNSVAKASIGLIGGVIRRLSLLKTDKIFVILRDKLDSTDDLISSYAISSITQYPKEKKIEVADKLFTLLKQSDNNFNSNTPKIILFFYTTYGINFGQMNMYNIAEIKQKIIDFYEKEIDDKQKVESEKL